MAIGLVPFLGLFVTSLLAAIGGLLAISLLQRRTGNDARGLFAQTASTDTTFLFDGEVLIDATDAGRALLAASGGQGDAWHQLLGFVIPRFPEFEIRLRYLPEDGQIALTSSGTMPITLVAEWRAGLTRISLVDPRREGQIRTVDALSQRALEEELVTLRATMDLSPALVWRENEKAEVVWANRAYLVQSARRLAGEEIGWPLPHLFDAEETRGVAPGTAQRLSLQGPDKDKSQWYDCHVFPLEADRLIFALPAGTAVQAETALREFVQTLSKTFAHLPIGLAIFDRERRLQLFNPALTDLIGLPVDMLSARPKLFAFLDAMRERQMIPEPKDYKTWRGQMLALEKAAASGLYEELWSLPGGQTYRVVGRPHPDGAVALLFEDISAEVSLTRRFRAELELGQSVIDAMDQAVAVFSPAGMMVLSNEAYAQLWGNDPAEVLTECGVIQATQVWQEQCAPTPVWKQMQRFVMGLEDRCRQDGEVRMSDGRLLSYRLQPLTGGATMIRFDLPVTAIAKRGSRTQAGKAGVERQTA